MNDHEHTNDPEQQPAIQFIPSLQSDEERQSPPNELTRQQSIRKKTKNLRRPYCHTTQSTPQLWNYCIQSHYTYVLTRLKLHPNEALVMEPEDTALHFLLYHGDPPVTVVMALCDAMKKHYDGTMFSKRVLELRGRWAGRTPLHFMAVNSNVETAKYLINLSLKLLNDTKSSNPFDTEEGRRERLLAPRDEKGITPLHLACQYGKVATVELLVSALSSSLSSSESVLSASSSTNRSQKVRKLKLLMRKSTTPTHNSDMSRASPLTTRTPLMDMTHCYEYKGALLKAILYCSGRVVGGDRSSMSSSVLRLPENVKNERHLVEEYWCKAKALIRANLLTKGVEIWVRNSSDVAEEYFGTKARTEDSEVSSNKRDEMEVTCPSSNYSSTHCAAGAELTVVVDAGNTENKDKKQTIESTVGNAQMQEPLADAANITTATESKHTNNGVVANDSFPFGAVAAPIDVDTTVEKVCYKTKKQQVCATAAMARAAASGSVTIHNNVGVTTKANGDVFASNCTLLEDVSYTAATKPVVSESSSQILAVRHNASALVELLETKPTPAHDAADEINVWRNDENDTNISEAIRTKITTQAMVVSKSNLTKEGSNLISSKDTEITTSNPPEPAADGSTSHSNFIPHTGTANYPYLPAFLLAPDCPTSTILLALTIYHNQIQTPVVIHTTNVSCGAAPEVVYPLHLAAARDWHLDDIVDDTTHSNTMDQETHVSIVIRTLINSFPQVARISCSFSPMTCGNDQDSIKPPQSRRDFPLAIAIKSGKQWNDGVSHIFHVAPDTALEVDPETGLYLFMLAAAAHDDTTDSLHTDTDDCEHTDDIASSTQTEPVTIPLDDRNGNQTGHKGGCLNTTFSLLRAFPDWSYYSFC